MNANHSRTDAPRRPGRRQVLQGGVGLVAGSAAAFLLACGGEKKEESKSTATGGAQGTAAVAAGTQTPKRGGKLTETWNGATVGFNPVIDFIQGHFLQSVKVYDRLISTRLGKDTSKDYVLEAAQSVEQPDPTTVVFKLKPGLKYQDRAPVSGRAVTAEDIVKTHLYVRDEPRTEQPLFHQVWLQSVEAPNTQTVVFKLKMPHAYLFSEAQLSNSGAHCIIPKELLDNPDTNWPIGSGPYQLVEAENSIRYKYKRFEGYREAAKGLPYIDEREFLILVDTAAAEAGFRSEQIQSWQAPLPTIAEQLKKDLGARIDQDEFLSLQLTTFAANINKPPWNDVRVREAIYRLLNRQQIVDLLEGGKGKVLPGYLSLGLTEYQLDASQTEKYFKQDLKAAKQLLDAAGFPYNREVEMSAINSPRNNQGCEIFQQQASQVGIKVRITPMPFPQWLQEKMPKGDWEVWYAAHPAYDTPLVPLRLQTTKGFGQHVATGLKEPQVDAMIARSEQTLDRNERIKLVKDVQIALLDKYTPFINTHNFNVYWNRWKYLKGWEVNQGYPTQPMYRTELWLDR
jgi:peptide/nickel transport system substrate-binding protein